MTGAVDRGDAGGTNAAAGRIWLRDSASFMRGGLREGARPLAAGQCVRATTMKFETGWEWHGRMIRRKRKNEGK